MKVFRGSEISVSWLMPVYTYLSCSTPTHGCYPWCMCEHSFTSLVYRCQTSSSPDSATEGSICDAKAFVDWQLVAENAKNPRMPPILDSRIPPPPTN